MGVGRVRRADDCRVPKENPLTGTANIQRGRNNAQLAPKILVLCLLLISVCGCATEMALKSDFWDKKGMKIGIAIVPYPKPIYEVIVKANIETNESMDETQKKKVWAEAEEQATLMDGMIGIFFEKFTPSLESKIKSFDRVKNHFKGRLENCGFIVTQLRQKKG